jgi:aryl-alcohol dehydrogenase-like predicted oxidoreductase
MNNPLPTRRLGGSGLNTTSIGLGLMSLSGTYGESSDDNGIAVIRHALDAASTFSTRPTCMAGATTRPCSGARCASERHGRDKVVIATKFGQVKLASGGNGVDGRPEYVQAACEASLKRLGVEVIDLYYVHRIDPKVPIEDTVGAMARLVEQGKVRALGLCEASPATIRRAHRVHPLAALQTEYSLLYREEAEETLKTTRELDIAFVAYAPLGRSLLTGAVHDVADSRQRPPQGSPALSSGQFRAQPRRCGRSSRRWRRRRDARRRNSPWRGCWRRATISSRFPAPSAVRGSMRNSGRSTLRWRPPKCRRCR